MTSPCLAHGCDACCWETEMLLSEEDVQRLVAAGHRREDFVAIDAEGHAGLRNVPSADDPSRAHCVFLKDKRCSVYEHRPQGCRFYPLTLASGSFKLVRDADCPHRGEFPMDPTAGRRMLKLVQTIVREAKRRA